MIGPSMNPESIPSKNPEWKVPRRLANRNFGDGGGGSLLKIPAVDFINFEK
jgi:hypothetical protein